MSHFTRRCTAPRAKVDEWLVAAGDDAELHVVECTSPDPTFIRRLLHLPPETPIIVVPYYASAG